MEQDCAVPEKLKLLAVIPVTGSSESKTQVGVAAVPGSVTSKTCTIGAVVSILVVVV
jgi:hypothetical protein